MIIAFPLRIVRLKLERATPAECEAQQLAACDRWGALSTSQQFRRQVHRAQLLKLPPRYAGDAPDGLPASDAIFLHLSRTRGKFLAQLTA